MKRTDRAGRDVTDLPGLWSSSDILSPTADDLPRTPSGAIDGNLLDPIIDYADMLGQLNEIATYLELEATLGNPADTDRLSKAANHIRDAWATLYPLVDDAEITAADPATTEGD